MKNRYFYALKGWEVKGSGYAAKPSQPDREQGGGCTFNLDGIPRLVARWQEGIAVRNGSLQPYICCWDLIHSSCPVYKEEPGTKRIPGMVG